MGGYGSGQRWGATKPVIEAHRRIDVNWLNRNGYLRDGSIGTLQWMRDGERVASVGIKGGRQAVELTYRARDAGGEWEDIEYSVPIVWSVCRFGGERPYFICPGVVNGQHCTRRVLKIYGPGRYFLCRHCYGMAYASQNEDKLDRAYRRTAKLKRRLGVEDRTEPVFLKPKGMHQATFDRLREQADEAEEEADHLFTVKAAQLLGRLGHPAFKKGFWE